jgi:hypothetical protein
MHIGGLYIVLWKYILLWYTIVYRLSSAIYIKIIYTHSNIHLIKIINIVLLFVTNVFFLKILLFYTISPIILIIKYIQY